MGNDVSKLDPKLKEAYDRVMGTTITPPQPPKPETHEQTRPEPAPQQTATVNPPPQQHDESSSGSIVHKATGKKGGRISPLLIAFLGLIFFVLYAAVWIKVFNFKFPFLNP